jgi:hypothetical protein
MRGEFPERGSEIFGPSRFAADYERALTRIRRSLWPGEKLGLTMVSLTPVTNASCCAILRRLLCAGLLTPHERLTEGLLPSECPL